jgi:hypothetical protein
VRDNHTYIRHCTLNQSWAVAAQPTLQSPSPCRCSSISPGQSPSSPSPHDARPWPPQVCFYCPPQQAAQHGHYYLDSVWLKSQVERSRSVPVLLFGYKVTRTKWLQLENIFLRFRTIPLQKINRTEPLRSHPARTVTLRSVHSATKQKTEPLRSRLPNTEQSGSVSKIRDGTTPFYLTPQPNTTLVPAKSAGSDT